MRIEQWGAVFFAIALVHTFLAGSLRHWGHRYAKGSPAAELFHILGEVEIVFGLWAAIFMGTAVVLESGDWVLQALKAVDLTEAWFVFVIMSLCATKPVLTCARRLIQAGSLFLKKIFGIPLLHAQVLTVLVIGPLSGSLITEPAAMTVTALLLVRMLKGKDLFLLYALLGVLFVNVSIGGALTPYAAPPILMVSQVWKWDLTFVLTHLGWKSAVAVFINALLILFVFRKKMSEQMKALENSPEENADQIPFWVTALHFIFILGVILSSHYPVIFVPIFIFFLGLFSITKKYQNSIRLKESFLVAFFLAGIIVFGPYQAWWLKPILSSLGDGALFLAATALTSITDNAALTFLGAQVPDLAESAKVFLVAGALAGGGLTVIANAPNPAGYSLLLNRFPNGEIKPLFLFLGALPATLIALACLWFL